MGDAFRIDIAAREFRLDLTLEPTQRPLLQGEGGYSRKGPNAKSASYYYTMPHLEVSGTVTRDGNARPVTGEAWLDREWSSQYMESEAEGWDWTGINLDDGAALMAFRMRRKGGGTVWAGGTIRSASGRGHLAQTRRHRIRAEPDVAIAALGRELPGGDEGARGHTRVRARAHDGRSGKRHPAFNRHHLLGRRRAGEGGGARGGARLPGAHRILERHAGAIS